MTTVEEAFEQLKKLPDWERYPYPEVFYKHFDVKKPKPLTSSEIANFNPIQWMYFGAKPAETRGPAPGGVREIKDYQTLPVEVKMITDQSGVDMTQYLTTNSSTLPTEDNMTKIRVVSGHLSSSPSHVVSDTNVVVPDRGAE